jgi:hypothetical protein
VTGLSGKTRNRVILIGCSFQERIKWLENISSIPNFNFRLFLSQVIEVVH